MNPLCMLKSSWLLIWFLRKRRCHLGGTRQLSATLMVWACGWLHIFTQCKQQTADMRVWMYLRVCIYCGVDTNWQRPAIVQSAAYLHLTRAGAWCEMWFICDMLRPVLWTQRYLLSYPQHSVIYWPPALPTAVAELLMWLQTSSLWHPSRFPLCFSLSSHLLPAVAVIQTFHCFSVFIYQVICSSALWLVA